MDYEMVICQNCKQIFVQEFKEDAGETDCPYCGEEYVRMEEIPQEGDKPTKLYWVPKSKLEELVKSFVQV